MNAELVQEDWKMEHFVITIGSIEIHKHNQQN